MVLIVALICRSCFFHQVCMSARVDKCAIIVRLCHGENYCVLPLFLFLSPHFRSVTFSTPPPLPFFIFAFMYISVHFLHLRGRAGQVSGCGKGKVDEVSDAGGGMLTLWMCVDVGGMWMQEVDVGG